MCLLSSKTRDRFRIRYQPFKLRGGNGSICLEPTLISSAC